MTPLEFAEKIANHGSSNLHGFYSELITEARRIVKEHGGRLRKVGRYEEGSAPPRPVERYRGGQWISPVLNRETDTWSFPEARRAHESP